MLKPCPFAMRLLVLSLLLAPLAAPALSAQDESVNPGINKNFEDNPDVDRFIGMFESESREIYRFRDQIVAALGLEAGQTIADIGAGTGLFTRPMAAAVGETGKVYAVEIAQEFLDHITATAKEAGLSNVAPVLCTAKSTELPPASVDLAFVCDTYHHFEFPEDTLASIHQAIRPGGHLAVIDFKRIEGESRQWVLDHVYCGQEEAAARIRAAGFEKVKDVDMMEEQYFTLFRKVDRSGP